MYFQIDFSYGSSMNSYEYFEIRGKAERPKIAKKANKTIKDHFKKYPDGRPPRSVKIREYDKDKHRVIKGGHQIVATKFTQTLVNFAVVGE